MGIGIANHVAQDCRKGKGFEPRLGKEHRGGMAASSWGRWNDVSNCGADIQDNCRPWKTLKGSKGKSQDTLGQYVSHPSPCSIMSIPVSKEEVARKLRLDYESSEKDHNAKVPDAIGSLFSTWSKDRSYPASFKETAKLISICFRIKEVGIGVRGSDRLYRMVVFYGYRPETEDANRKLVYTEADFGESEVYKGISISPLTRAYFSEDSPYANIEEATFNRPTMLKGKRKATEESIEGDYFDTVIRDSEGAMLGWIEYGGTSVGKLPDVQSIKWIELIASTLGQFMSSSSGPPS